MRNIRLFPISPPPLEYCDTVIQILEYQWIIELQKLKYEYLSADTEESVSGGITRPQSRSADGSS